jgi:hypothetical protein
MDAKKIVKAPDGAIQFGLQRIFKGSLGWNDVWWKAQRKKSDILIAP